MAEIDEHSETWKAVVEQLQERRESAIENLIAGMNSERQRGQIALIDEILGLTDTSKTVVISADYEV